MKMTSCHVEVVSDIVCPWCYVGLGQLRQALGQVDTSSVSVTVSWSPYMLNPNLPAEGISRHDYLVILGYTVRSVLRYFVMRF